VLPYGTRVQVQEALGYHARVSLEDGTLGWVRAAEVVPPRALSGAGSIAAAGTASFTTAEISAAGRQFDQKTERTYREIDRDLSAAYPLVDEVEQTKPDPEAVDHFITEGVLGRCGDQPVQDLSPVPMTKPLIPWRGEATAQMSPVASHYVDRMRERFSPEQEYWLGRSVAAAAIARYGLDPNVERQALVRRVGAALVRLSNRLGATYGGWHFAVLDDDAANGVSGPGGFVLVTRGALERARDEDEVAGILAHECAHVTLRHGEQVIRRHREFQASMERLDRLAEAEPPGRCDVYCGEVARFLGETAKTLVTTLSADGYGKDYEYPADWEGSLLLCEAGYRVGSIATYLRTVPGREKTDWDTHPTSAERIEALRMMVEHHTTVGNEGYAARTERFRAVMADAARPQPPRRLPPRGAPGAPPAAR
jgi:hypothetical protein